LASKLGKVKFQQFQETENQKTQGIIGYTKMSLRIYISIYTNMHTHTCRIIYYIYIYMHIYWYTWKV